MIATIGNPTLMQHLNLWDCLINGNSASTATSVTAIFSSRAVIASKNNTFRNLPTAFSNSANYSTITSEDDIFDNVDVLNSGTVTFI
jgi:hypothetical protein